jgi:hypothetical protein
MNELFLGREKSTIGSFIHRFKEGLIKTLRLHSLFLALVLFYLVAALIAAIIYDSFNKLSISLYSDTLILMTTLFFVIYFIGYALYVMIFIRPDSPIEYFLVALKTNQLTMERLLNALPVFLFLPIFMSTFTSFKTMIPVINPFSWDYRLAKLDAIVHGGIQPWRLLQPVFGYPLFTSVINFFYNLWFFVMFGVLFWQTFSLRNRRLRMQFLLTFMLLWILLGTFAAIIFSSAGPCYYGRLVEGKDIYKPLMEYLESAKESYPVWALGTQEILWQSYKNGGVGQVTGISAMPSMHVSIVFLFALLGWRTHRIVGIGFSIFAVLIMIGCVHLGWHYAIDAYLSIVLTWLIWWCVGRLLVWRGVVSVSLL